MLTTIARRKRKASRDPGPDLPKKSKDNTRLALVTNGYLMFVVLPMWIIPGFGDWLCHRASKIEQTSGTHESLTHSLMMACVGVPTLMALFLEINAGMLLLFLGAFLAHEAIVIWDVAYADGRREVTPTEQHFHSFLEVLPFMSLSFLLCVHYEQVLALIGRAKERAVFALHPKGEPASALYIVGVLGTTGVFLGLPYAEELARCYAADKTFAPHARKGDA